MKKLLVSILSFASLLASSQELYVITEPASNMPAKSMSVKLTGQFIQDNKVFDRPAQRFMPEIMLGINKNLMLHVSSTFANMNTSHFNYESVSFYGKYRFLADDDLHRHFRMAAFLNASHTSSPFHYEELNLKGDKTGAEAGLIATQLWNKLAVSGAVSNIQLLDSSRFNDIVYLPERIYQAMNYSLSAGYLLLPREYRSYNQLNVNVYFEILAQQTLTQHRYYIDFAPAIQFIFNSNAKLNVGYRFEASGNMDRMSKESWLISFERTFLNLLDFKKKKR
jgi:hypothetical protein